jgi:hypothetical protein
MLSSRLLLTACFASALTLAGCGGGPDRPQTAKVTGKVLNNGQPVADAAVVFYPQVEGGARTSSGRTDASGAFTLDCFDKGDGAVLGKHKVTVNPGAEVTESNDPAALKTVEASRGKLPEKFSTAEKTTITVDVVEDESKNVFDLDLSKL